MTWNVNGIKSAMKKGFLDYINKANPDIVCLQETRIGSEKEPYKIEGYESYFNNANKKGYSGTAILSKNSLINVSYGMGNILPDDEGRVITAEYENFTLVNVYAPISRDDFSRLEYRELWDDSLFEYVKQIAKKPIIICGDMNVAHKDQDACQGPYIASCGTSNQERCKFTRLLWSGLVDCWRHFNPDGKNDFTCWPYCNDAKEQNVGMRFDYFLVSKSHINNVTDISICREVSMSDHCPVTMTINL